MPAVHAMSSSFAKDEIRMNIPGMVYCRCCGKEIHESAPACPQCGGLQNAKMPAAAKGKEPGLWMPITALICAILDVLALMDDKLPDRDETVGLVMFGIVGIMFGSVSIRNQSAGKKMAITAVILSVLSIVVVIGMHAK
jgi:uncharacterized membrane protein